MIFKTRQKSGGDKIANTSSKLTSDALNKVIADLESKVDTIATTLFSTNEFAQVVNGANSLSLRLKKGVADQMARNMAVLNVPSRDDVEALGERLMIMDERLIRIERALSKLVPPDPAAKRAGPPRTKKPPTQTAAPTSPRKPRKKPMTAKGTS